MELCPIDLAGEENTATPVRPGTILLIIECPIDQAWQSLEIFQINSYIGNGPPYELLTLMGFRTSFPPVKVHGGAFSSKNWIRDILLEEPKNSLQRKKLSDWEKKNESVWDFEKTLEIDLDQPAIGNFSRKSYG